MSLESQACDSGSPTLDQINKEPCLIFAPEAFLSRSASLRILTLHQRFNLSDEVYKSNTIQRLIPLGGCLRYPIIARLSMTGKDSLTTHNERNSIRRRCRL